MADMNRRRFMQLAASTAAMGYVAPSLQAQTAGAKVKLGLIGCGNRGGWIGTLFQKHGGYEVVALADYFPDRLEKVGNNLKVDPARRYAGLNGYKRVLDHGGVDAVAIISPPYFHPIHASAAIDAGKHVYVAKPVAVDVPGCNTIKTSGLKATQSKQVMLVDFQTRVNEFYVEALKQVHAGVMGDVTFIDAKYHGGQLRPRGKVDDSPESRLRNWVFDIALSGDIITEQFVHSLDVTSWVMDRTPMSATATCGRKVRTQVGDCNDNFTALIKYGNGVGCTFSGKQYSDGASNEGIVVNAFGTKGRLLTKYGGRVVLYGKPYYKGGESKNIYLTGPTANIAQFYRSITTGIYDNPTVAPSVRSTLLTILVRTAAYTDKTITWEQLLADAKPMDGRLEGLKA